MHQEQSDHETDTARKIGAALLVVLVIALIGWVSDSQSATSAPVAQVGQGALSASAGAASGSKTDYKDGSYTASSSYITPGGQQGITVNVTLKNGTVAGASVGQQADNQESRQYQRMFEQRYQSYILGQPVDNLNLFAVSGASLTTGGFDDALAQIRNQAR